MDLEKLRIIGETLDVKRQDCTTEEATKTALILPFIRAIGYDIFNPAEVMPEFIADVGEKKGEKIDYALRKDGEVIILIECKKIGVSLTKDNTDQLKRYFPTLKGKLAILTNGETYKFYTDLVATNLMDDEPFFEFTIQNLSEESIKEITKISKNEFNINNIKENAKYLLNYKGVKEKIYKEFDEPSREFIDFFARGVHQGLINQRVIDNFKPLISDAIQAYCVEKLKNSFKMPNITENSSTENTNIAPTAPIEDNKSSANLIETTLQELEAFCIVKSILHRNKIDISLIEYVDTVNYFAINYQGKSFCRLSFTKKNNTISLFEKDTKKWLNHKFDSLNNLYDFEEQILNNIKSS